MESLSGRVIRGGLWMVALNVTARLLGMVRLFILARLLTPYDFGLFGIALVLVDLVHTFSALGTHLALIQRKERARDLFDTAWTLGLIRGACVAALVFALAPLVALFFETQEAVAICRVMGLVPLINGLANIGVVEFRKELTMRPYYLLHASGTVVDLCVAVPLALWHASAWALVGGWLAMTAVRVVISYRLHPYRPRLRLDRGELRELLAYGRWVFGTLTIDWLTTSGVHVMVGRVLGVPVLGLYQMAWRVASQPTTEVTGVIAGVTMAAYAKLQDSAARVRVAYLRVLAAVALVAVPVAMAIETYGEDFVRLFLGPRWGAIAPLVKILAVVGLLRAIGATAAPVFQALGRPRLQTVMALVELCVLACLLAPLTLWMGSVGTALAAAAAATCAATASLTIVSRVLGARAGGLGPILGWPLVACVSVAAPRIWLAGPLDTVIGLAGAIIVSGMLYLIALLLLDRLDLYRLSAVAPPGVTRWLPRRVG